MLDNIFKYVTIVLVKCFVGYGKIRLPNGLFLCFSCDGKTENLRKEENK